MFVSVGMILHHATTLEDYGTALDRVLSAGNFLRSFGENCLLLTVQAETLSALETLWKEYQNGTLQTRLQEFLVTEELKQLTGEEVLELTVKIDEKEYKDALLDLMILAAKGI